MNQYQYQDDRLQDLSIYIRINSFLPHVQTSSGKISLEKEDKAISLYRNRFQN